MYETLTSYIFLVTCINYLLITCWLTLNTIHLIADTYFPTFVLVHAYFPLSQRHTPVPKKQKTKEQKNNTKIIISHYSSSGFI